MGSLRRSRRDRWIFGVCGGLAHAFGWSPNMVRLATAIVAIIIPGISVIPAVVVYVVLGVLMPEGEEL